MQRNRTTLLLVLFTLLCQYAKADLKYMPLRIELSSEQSTYASGEVIQFNVKFTNSDAKQHALILPGTLNKGRKIIYFSIYTVDENDFYTELARESREIDMDSIYYSQSAYKYIQAKESISIPVFFNDTVNYRKHIEAHHKLPKRLLPGEYQVLAWYDPWDQKLASNAFNKISSYDKSDAEELPHKMNLPGEGLQSNYFKLTISDAPATKVPWIPTAFCPANCKLCKLIDRNQWNKVKKEIASQTDYKDPEGMAYTDTTWMQAHRNIAWLGYSPDAVLASLPTYTGRNIIFRNADGYHYFRAHWQMGIMYQGRSRISSLLFRRRSLIKTSEVDYLKLLSLKPY